MTVDPTTYRGHVLDRFQQEAVDHMLDGRSVLVCAPTGTGKTLIADRLVEQVLGEGGEVIYTAPVKALSNQKFREYSALLGEDRVGLVTGDQVIRRDAPLRIMTTEILRNMLLTHEPLGGLRAVVFDEIHFLDERERGTVWEECLIYLPDGIRLLGLSATLSNLETFRDWLSDVRDEDVALVHETERAVPLTFLLANRSVRACELPKFARTVAQVPDAGPRRGRGRRKGRSRSKGGARTPSRSRREQATTHIDIVRQLDPDLLPCLYFLNSRRGCEVFGGQLLRRQPRFLDPGEEEQVEGELGRFEETYPGVLGTTLAAMLRQGIGIHHAGLHVHLKVLVERLYERRLVHVLYCTSTFALGINMPARTVVFHELKRFDGREMVPLGVREFQQMAGRAGRRGIDPVGYVVVRMEPGDFRPLQATLRHLFEGNAEPVRSSFNLSFNSVVHLLDRFDQDELRELLELSFLAFSVRRRRHKRGRKRGGRGRDPVWEAFERKVALLQHIGYLDQDGTAFAGARVLAGMQIEEIFTTELVLRGVLDRLPPPQLYGALCALAVDITRAARTRRPGGELARVATQLRKVRLSEPVRLAEREQGVTVTFCPEMIPIGAAWHEGRPLIELVGELEANSDVSGLLVNGFRRAKDLAGQLRRVYDKAEDEMMADRLREIVRTVSRDEVEVVG